jgi:hypothetical protein
MARPPCCTPAGGVGEAARLPGVELDGGPAGLAQGALEAAVICAGHLEQEARWLVWFGPADQPLNASPVVSEAPAAARRQQVTASRRSLETSMPMVTGSPEMPHGGSSFPVPCSSSGAPDRPVRPQGKEGDDQTLARSSRPAFLDPSPYSSPF